MSISCCVVSFKDTLHLPFCIDPEPLMRRNHVPHGIYEFLCVTNVEVLLKLKAVRGIPWRNNNRTYEV
jgi:hypothetical protein